MLLINLILFWLYQQSYKQSTMMKHYYYVYTLISIGVSADI
jgi:hypothetical protein